MLSGLIMVVSHFYTTLDYAGINLDVNDIVITAGDDEFRGCFS